MDTTTFDESQQLAARTLVNNVRGNVVLPDDETYATARRVWNCAVDLRPAMIAFCETVEDVQAAVRTAHAHHLPISVRGTGYDVTGRSVRSDSLVIDLSRMNRVEVNGRTVTVSGGATAAAVVSAADASGLIAVTGWNGVVGMTGLTLNGGYGPLIASHGLALDSLVGAELILADGRRVTANTGTNADLLWALQGGGGNFGVVTSMTFRLHPHRQVMGGMIMFPWTDADKVLNGYAGTAASAGNDLSVLAGMFCFPDGTPVLFLAPVWTGEPAQGDAVMADLQTLGTPIHTQIGSMSYKDLIQTFDSRVANGRSCAVQTRWIPALTPKVIEAIITSASKPSSPFSTIILQHFRGAAAQVPLEATAFGLRHEHFLVEVIAAWDGDHDADHRAWAQDLSNALAPASLPGGYPPLLASGDRERIAQAYGSNLARLRDVKRQFDPQGLFSATPLPV